jgi:hypothetical protein
VKLLYLCNVGINPLLKLFHLTCGKHIYGEPNGNAKHNLEGGNVTFSPLQIHQRTFFFFFFNWVNIKQHQEKTQTTKRGEGGRDFGGFQETC